MPVTKEQAMRLTERAQNDPNWFITKMLGADLWYDQIRIAESVRDNRYTSVVACHGPGKTFLAAHIALWFLYSHKPSKVITTAPTNRQVYSLLWSEMRTAHAKGGKIRPLGGEPLKTRLELAADWFAEGFASSEYDTERTTGYHSEHILIIVDEASGVPDAIYDALEGLMSSGHARMLLIGNPSRSTGKFRESFDSPIFTNFRISAFDTPNFAYYGITREDMIDGSWAKKVANKPILRPYLVTPQWVAERMQTWGPSSTLIKTKVDALFPEGDESDKVIPLSFIDTAQNLVYREDEEYAKVEIGVDVARYGSDESVIAIRAGRAPLKERIIHQKSTMNLVGAIREEVELLGAHRVDKIKIDVIGLGAGPVDRLEELQDSGDFPEHIDIIGVSVAMSAKDSKRFVTHRDELWWQFRESLSEGLISARNISDEAVKELVEPTYSMTSRGQIKVEGKDDLRKADRLGRSPDRADAWLLAFGDVVREGRKKPVKIRAKSVRRGR